MSDHFGALCIKGLKIDLPGHTIFAETKKKKSVKICYLLKQKTKKKISENLLLAC